MYGMNSNSEKQIRTHINYAEYMCHLSNKLVIKSRAIIHPANCVLVKTKELIRKKYRLIQYMYGKLCAEKEQISEKSDYSTICSCWIAPKSYYILFYQLCLIKTLLDSSNSISYEHANISRWVKNMIRVNNLNFSNDVFNSIYSYQDICSSVFPPGLNLKKYKNLNDNEIMLRKLQLLHKLSEECYEFKKYKYKGKKYIRKKVLRDETFSLFEFFYWYRIKSNYRDISFLYDNDDQEWHTEFYLFYFESTTNFFHAYDRLIRDLYFKRFTRHIND